MSTKNKEIASHMAIALGLNNKTQPKTKPKPTVSIAKNSRLQEIVNKLFMQVDEAKTAYQRLMYSAREIFKEYYFAAIEEGYTPREAWLYIRNRMAGHVVSKVTLYAWASEDLPTEAIYIQMGNPKSGIRGKRYSRDNYRNQISRYDTNTVDSNVETKSNKNTLQITNTSTEQVNTTWENNQVIWQIPLKEAKAEEVDQYDEVNCKRLLREALEVLSTLQKQGWKW